uniref:Uncharacterized protein n=1 Tax=Cacopsylla melanoneura TaxID=428564 RepID=A0A8D9BRP9_9HEMI
MARFLFFFSEPCVTFLVSIIPTTLLHSLPLFKLSHHRVRKFPFIFCPFFSFCLCFPFVPPSNILQQYSSSIHLYRDLYSASIILSAIRKDLLWYRILLI